MTEPTTTLTAPNAKLRPSLIDYLRLTLIPFYISWAFLQVLARRAKNVGRNEIPFLKDFFLTMARTSPLPISLLRSTSDASNTILTSPRFRPHASNLYHPILTPTVAGYWMCNGPPNHPPITPSKADIVLYYIHGGAYTEGHPARALPLLLRTAELAATCNLTLSCFALRYSYAPEAKWPTQLTQAVAGYRYLLQEQGVDATKVAVLGESAGAHLALSMLASLQEAALPRPGRGVFFQSPWVDLGCTEHGSWRRNRYTDFLALDALRRCGRRLFADEAAFAESPFRDFSTKKALPEGRSWKDVLPERVWMSAGGSEVLLDEIVGFRDVLRGDGVDVEFEVEEGGMHVWQGMGDVFDIGTYLRCIGEMPEGLMRGARNVAEAVLRGVEM